MGQYKLIKFYCEIGTDGDFAFKLIPPCMKKTREEHYEIEFSEVPNYNETDEEFLNRVIEKLTFIKDSLNTYIVGKDWFVESYWPKFGEYIDGAIERIKDDEKYDVNNDEYSDCVFTGNQECTATLKIFKYTKVNQKKDYSVKLKENNFLRIADSINKIGLEDFDGYMEYLWETIRKLYEENTELKLNELSEAARNCD